MMSAGTLSAVMPMARASFCATLGVPSAVLGEDAQPGAGRRLSPGMQVLMGTLNPRAQADAAAALKGWGREISYDFSDLETLAKTDELAEFLRIHQQRLAVAQGDLERIEQQHDVEAQRRLGRVFARIAEDAGYLHIERMAQVCQTAQEFLEQAPQHLDVSVLTRVYRWLQRVLQGVTAEHHLSMPSEDLLSDLGLNAFQGAVHTPGPSVVPPPHRTVCRPARGSEERPRPPRDRSSGAHSRGFSKHGAGPRTQSARCV